MNCSSKGAIWGIEESFLSLLSNLSPFPLIKPLPFNMKTNISMEERREGVKLVESTNILKHKFGY